MVIKFKINGLGITDKQFNQLPFGRQLEYRYKIQAFQNNAERTDLSQKRITHAKAWKEFLKLYQPDQWYTKFHDSDSVRDDSFTVYYTTPNLGV